ncbi:MAG: hypothetical protein ACRD29_22345 [Acidimicrobiales bacterium]
MTTRRRRRLAGDRGAGVLSTAFGVLAFLLFLLFTVQVLVNLFFTSTVTSVAHDAATVVAHSDVHPAPQSVLNEAEEEFRTFIGGAGADADLTWNVSDPDVVALTVSVPYPSLASSFVRIPYFERLERTIRVRTEQVQD